MEITLIRPPRVFEKFNKALKPAAPIGIAYLASVLSKDGHNVNMIDGIVEGIDEIHKFSDSLFIQGLNAQQIIERINKDTQIVGLSCMFTVDWLYLKHIINKITDFNPDIKIILGGEHITALPSFCYEECPSIFACVLGEGEETIVELVDAIKHNKNLSTIPGLYYKNEDGELIKTSKRQRLKNIDDIPIPQWDLLPTKTYFQKNLSFGVGNKRTLPILATRGCPYKCSFCSSPDMWGTRYYMRSVTNVVDEIEYLINNYNVENIDLYDLTAIIKADWIIAFCKEIIRRNLNITWQLPSGTRSEAITKEVVQYMKASGCTVVTYAPESGSNKVLNDIYKKVNLKKMLNSISDSNKVGLIVKVNIIIGLPMEKHIDILKTIFFILKCSWYGAYDMGPNPYHPIPGTELFHQLFKDGKIDIRNTQYYIDLIRADNIWKVKFYNDKIPTPFLKTYFIIYLLIFYVSNYIFYPNRLWDTIVNVWKMTPQSRGQHVLVRIFEQFKTHK